MHASQRRTGYRKFSPDKIVTNPAAAANTIKKEEMRISLQQRKEKVGMLSPKVTPKTKQGGAPSQNGKEPPHASQAI